MHRDHRQRGAAALTLFLPLALSAGSVEARGREDPYAAAAQVAAEFWSDWGAATSKSKITEKPYRSTTAAGERVLLWYPKGVSKSKLVKSSAKAVKVFDSLFEACLLRASLTKRDRRPSPNFKN